MTQKPELYFKNDKEWRSWLHQNHNISDGVYLIFYKVESKKPSMRWEEAVKVALSYGWIDSTVKKLDDERRRQYFCPRKPKSVWSKLNKTYIVELTKEGLLHKSGLLTIETAKKNGSWIALDDVENGIIPDDLKKAFNKNDVAFKNFQAFSRSYRKNYLYWLNQAKRQETRDKRIIEIIRLCKANIKDRGNR
ncbi:YdeI/OmpD-associated family protein [Aquimarina sp. 2201CG5-10]|uniref:YdeI/OmpD-associated family protein n=1 Tax=Aquimarina callyspongiae TaxID=3098150 RepID=UPI002AB35134|nr:YdeI/OmpD-associated family protein [Aquimarina sp. 2201CG5-10]MDY8137318.1 YdeI/OmpD-associated family protein [Aquimarina sp. 2201CG5-10]